ncbi:MAG: hypothetical protein NT027_15805 [Proteobacteria bacterium]|nr:hypothetical protein [Pseudomonadota bacterium]
MLKRVTINQRILPVPIPVRNLGEALAWVESTFVDAGQSITSVVLNGTPMIDLLADKKFIAAQFLNDSSKVEFKIESPVDLALQSLETSHNLCGAILRNIKYLAVHLWQSNAHEEQPELSQMHEDVEIIMELVDHVRVLGVETCIDFGPILDMQARLKKLNLSLSAALSRSDWKGCAQVLLRDTNSTTGLESTLKELQEELESSHLRLLTSRSTKAGNQ